MSIRTERVGAMLRQLLATHFQRQLPDYLEGMVTITAVRVSTDLSVAKVYVSIFNSKTEPDILVKRLNAHQKEVRTVLAREVQLRKMPELRFFLDDTLDAAATIDHLIEKVRAEDEERRAARGESEEQEGEVNIGRDDED
ncbi:MAG: 30S ribosome-binding factor RbfA [Candidatus Kapaibacterium sp.]